MNLPNYAHNKSKYIIFYDSIFRMKQDEKMYLKII